METFGKVKALILQEYAFKMSGWVAFWKLKPVVFQSVSLRCQVERVSEFKAITLPEYAHEMTAWEAFRNLRP